MSNLISHYRKSLKLKKQFREEIESIYTIKFPTNTDYEIDDR